MPNITIRDVYELVERVETKIDKTYVSKARFKPVETIVYGLVGLILIRFISEVVTSVVKASF